MDRTNYSCLTVNHREQLSSPNAYTNTAKLSLPSQVSSFTSLLLNLNRQNVSMYKFYHVIGPKSHWQCRISTTCTHNAIDNTHILVFCGVECAIVCHITAMDFQSILTGLNEKMAFKCHCLGKRGVAVVECKFNNCEIWIALWMNFYNQFDDREH